MVVWTHLSASGKACTRCRGSSSSKTLSSAAGLGCRFIQKRNRNHGFLLVHGRWRASPYPSGSSSFAGLGSRCLEQVAGKSWMPVFLPCSFVSRGPGRQTGGVGGPLRHCLMTKRVGGHTSCPGSRTPAFRLLSRGCRRVTGCMVFLSHAISVHSHGDGGPSFARGAVSTSVRQRVRKDLSRCWMFVRVHSCPRTGSP